MHILLYIGACSHYIKVTSSPKQSAAPLSVILLVLLVSVGVVTLEADSASMSFGRLVGLVP